jgi:hypothetical protein
VDSVGTRGFESKSVIIECNFLLSFSIERNEISLVQFSNNTGPLKKWRFHYFAVFTPGIDKTRRWPGIILDNCPLFKGMQLQLAKPTQGTTYMKTTIIKQNFSLF